MFRPPGIVRLEETSLIPNRVQNSSVHQLTKTHSTTTQLREETGEGILFDTTKNMQKKIQHPGNNPDDRKLSEIEYRKRTERNIWLTMPTNEMYIRNPDS